MYVGSHRTCRYYTYRYNAVKSFVCSFCEKSFANRTPGAFSTISYRAALGRLIFRATWPQTSESREAFGVRAHSASLVLGLPARRARKARNTRALQTLREIRPFPVGQGLSLPSG